MDSPATQRVTNRLTIERTAQPIQTATFADDVRAGLDASPRFLSPKWLYDDLGSALFDAICRLPEYDLTRVEGDILARYAPDIIAALDSPVDIIELGSGSAIKTRRLIEAAIARQGALRYQPIDISEEALLEASQRLAASYESLEIAAHAGDYFSVLERGKLPAAGRRLVLFLGSNIGNFDPESARHLLRAVAGALDDGDALLLGVDLKKNVNELEEAYDDPTGVTAAFTKNLLGRVNRELGGDFDLRAFTHVVHYDEQRGAVDSFLESRRDQRVRIKALAREYAFVQGERVHTESSYKFSRGDLDRIAHDSSFRVERVWSDARERFCEALFVKTNVAR